MTILLSMDDTDSLDSRGTGRLARTVAKEISALYPVYGVTRHQLFVHEDIPFTSHNSCGVVHIQAEGQAAADRIYEIAQEVMLGDFIEGSDPGVAVARPEQLAPALIAFGKDAKHIVLNQEKARRLAKNLRIPLKGLGGTEGGVIGAMAGLGLAATQNDGRFLMLGRIRELEGPHTAQELLEAGIDQICTTDGRPVTEGMILADEGKSVKPCPVGGKAVLFVDDTDGVLNAVKRD